jgi:hypothetical protein
MPGKGVSRILDSVDSFHHRFGQIPYLSRYGKASSQPNQRENGLREVREKKKRKSCDQTRQETTNRSFPGFPRAYAGIQFMPTEKTAAIKSPGVPGKDHRENKKNPCTPVGYLFEGDQQAEGKANIKHPKSNLPSLFCGARPFRGVGKEVETQNQHRPKGKKAWEEGARALRYEIHQGQRDTVADYPDDPWEAGRYNPQELVQGQERGK